MKVFFLVLGVLLSVENAAAAVGGKIAEVTPVVPTITGEVLNKIAFAFTVDTAIAATETIDLVLTAKTDSLQGDFSASKIEKIEYQCAAVADAFNKWLVTLDTVTAMETSATNNKISYTV